jgi:hypothetical protein
MTMDPQIQSAIIGSGIAVVSAGIGYAFREWRNHARPFLAITGFEGGFRKSNTEVQVPEEVVERLSTAFHIERLTNKEKLDRIHQTVKNAHEIQERAPTIVRRIDNILASIKASSSDETLCNFLADLFEPGYMDYYLALLLTKDRVKPPSFSPDLPVKVAAHPSSDYEGCVIIGFPGKPVCLGFNFSKDVFTKERFQPIIHLVQRLDRPGLTITFESLKAQVDFELSIAKDVLPKLEQLLDAHSLWEVRVYFANLRSTPILIEPLAQLYVRDKTGAQFQEECSMVIRTEQTSGEVTRKPADSPLIIPSGGHQSFSFFTKNTQKEMARGQAFRDAFSNKEAVAWLKLTVRGVGLVRRRSIETTKELFGETS